MSKWGIKLGYRLFEDANEKCVIHIIVKHLSILSNYKLILRSYLVQ